LRSKIYGTITGIGTATQVSKVFESVITTDLETLPALRTIEGDRLEVRALGAAEILMLLPVPVTLGQPRRSGPLRLHRASVECRLDRHRSKRA